MYCDFNISISVKEDGVGLGDFEAQFTDNLWGKLCF